MFRSLLVLAAIVAVCSPSFVFADHDEPIPTQAIIACNGASQCEGANATFVPHGMGCSITNLTGLLGVCIEPYGEGYGFGQVFCDANARTASITFYGTDSACGPANLQQVVVQRSDRCAQSNVVVCGSAHVPLPASLGTTPRFVQKTYCDDSTCAGDACAKINFIVDKCNTDLISVGNKYGACSNSHIMESAWNYTANPVGTLTCTPADQFTTIHHTVNGACIPAEAGSPSYYGQRNATCSELGCVRAAVA